MLNRDEAVEFPKSCFLPADGADSLLFSKEPWQGAFTVTGEYSALSLRTDRE